MKEVPEMRPSMVQVCSNTTKEVEECKMVEDVVEQEEMRPICSVKTMDKDHKPCSMGQGGGKECMKVMGCKLGKKMMKKHQQKKVCEKKKKKCFEMVKLEKKMMERKSCFFRPKTMCHPSVLKECRKVKKKMCNYLDSNSI